LFGGVVTASSVEATDGRGTAVGLQIDGAAVTATAGQTVPVDGWGQLTLGGTIGRVTAPLVLRLLQAHGSLAAGTAVVVGFAASAQPVARPRTHAKQPTGAARSRKQTAGTQRARKQRQPQKPPPDYPAAPSPFAAGGGFTDAVRDNPVVATALQYLGVPYQWGGASPKTGFDCSGLVQYVFAQLGVPLVHFAAAQYRAPNGVWIPPNRLQPGDLVFFVGSDGTRKEPGHVGIYVDNGYIIDAPQTGTVVRIDSIDEPKLADQYVGARRIDPQLIKARHLLRAPGASVSATGLFGLPPRITFAPLGESLGVAAAGPAAVRTASPGYWTWVGGILGGLLLLLVAGGLLARRRWPRVSPSGAPSD
jgi:cell wall-associated NlpC family hydrolase